MLSSKLTAVQATALAAELEALLAEELLEGAERPAEATAAAGLAESKPDGPPESSDSRRPELAKQILVETEESAETGSVAKSSQGAEEARA